MAASLTLTLVAEPLPFGIEQTAADILGYFDLGISEGRILSEGRAVDLSVEGEPRESVIAISAALREACPLVDFALLPAEGRRKRVLCADMDSTIVVGETIDELAAVLDRDAEVAAITERAMRGELDFVAALDERVAMLAGLDACEIDAVASRLRYTPGAAALVATMRAHGARCVLVSGGFDRVTGVVRETLGFHRDRANQLEVDADGRLTGKANRPVVDSGTKIETLRETVAELALTDFDALAIGDGANDRAMIEAAGLGIAWRGKPLLREATPFRIDHTDLRSALYFQGYTDVEIVESI